ncbi:DNA repair protein MmcB-related protein [Hyphomicrobium methylovorum]|uniref:MmcB family DNA repair protein n=1 Tax=Hyphomicrobium methylovorum TaxID=84 RepID=UPI0015E782AF|nr:MmcB family DNA repair protein [Hyphomicrobium methylovorum]MBA2126453.1 DNA repair protein MmcB-related protein [Hyphomicrobium methylovorum]
MTDTPSSLTNSFALDRAKAIRDDARARAILRGTQRLLRSLNFESLSEVVLASGRRADILAIGHNGEIWIIEIKSSIADLRADRKWPEYRDYCDALLFAVAPEFPAGELPEETGLILADAYGGELVRNAPRHPLVAPRRKAVTLAFARCAAGRLLTHIDPTPGSITD